MRIILILIVILFMSCIVEAAAPVLDNIITPQNLTQDRAYSYVIGATDPEGGDLVFSDDTGNFDISAYNTTAGIISFTPDSSLVGSFIAVILVRDSENLVDAQAVNFTVNGLPTLLNISNMNVTVGELFTYDIDANDTEDGTNLNFVDDSSLFVIDINTGIISFTPNWGQLGLYTINISVNDSKDVRISDTFVLAINDPVNISSGFPVSNATEDQVFSINLTEYVNNSIGALTFSNNQSDLLTIDADTGVVNFTVTNNTAGYHYINVTVQDLYGLNDSGIWTLNVTEVNDAPNFTVIVNQTAIVYRSFQLIVNGSDEEGDAIYYYDNTDLFDINETSGVINFTATADMIGINLINITVNNTNGANYTGSFYLTISINNPPYFAKNFTEVLYPGYDNYVDSQYADTNYRGSEFLYVANDSGYIKRTYLNFSLSSLSSTTNVFDAKLNFTINSDDSGENIRLYRINQSWIDSSLSYNNQPVVFNNNTVDIVTGTTIDSFDVTNLVLGWFNGTYTNYGVSIRLKNETSGTGTVKYYSSDSSNSSQWPNLYILHNKTIPSQSLNQGSNISNAFDLDDYFGDANGDTLNYTASSTSLVQVTIYSDNNNVSILSTGSSGSETVTFTANDGINTTTSNAVTITVNAVGTSSSSSSSSGGGGGGGSSEKIASISITFDSNRKSISQGELIQIPVIIENTGELDLRNIDLGLKVDKPGLVSKITSNFISRLNVGEKSNLNLLIDSSEAIGESYVISLDADSQYPTIKESAVFVLDVLTGGEGINEQLKLAQDLFKNNPECLELQELVDKAETQLKEGNYEESRKNIAMAIESCRNMIRLQEKPKQLQRSTLITVLIILSIATVVIIFSYTFLKRFKRTKRRKKKK